MCAWRDQQPDRGQSFRNPCGKIFGNEKREIEKFRKGNERFVDSKRVTYRYMAGYHAGMDAFTTLITVTALVSGAMFLAAGEFKRHRSCDLPFCILTILQSRLPSW